MNKAFLLCGLVLLASCKQSSARNPSEGTGSITVEIPPSPPILSDSTNGVVLTVPFNQCLKRIDNIAHGIQSKVKVLAHRTGFKQVRMTSKEQEFVVTCNGKMETMTLDSRGKQ